MIVQLLLGVQQVELVGGETWFEHNSVAVAAITAAALAAAVAVINQRAQLNHDREMRNRDHIRDVIDDAILAANQARTAVDHFVNLVTAAEEQRGEKERQLSKEATEYLVEQREKAFAEIQSMRRVKGRLEIRLDKSDPVVEAYQRTLTALTALFRQLFKGVQRDRPADLQEQDVERENELNAAFSKFQSACREWLRGGSPKGRSVRLARARNPVSSRDG